MNVRKLLNAIGLPLFLLLSFIGSAQDKVVTGKVTDSSGRGISGVSVSVKGQSSRGTTTADNGSYSLSVPAAATTLVFSSVGYGYHEAAISGLASANVTLQATAGGLNEVVVVAYGTRRRADLTGSVTAVSSKDFQKGFIPSPEQLLQGKVAGLQITSGGGSAGGGSKIRIRGGASLSASNEPLIVIDGVPVEGNGISGSGNLLSTINPNDIESVSVLKDASATALYGSRASNGVIIVTTKKGTRGKVRYNFNTQVSLSEVAKQVEVLTGDQVRDIITKDAASTGSNTYKSLLGKENTNWQKEIYRKAIGVDNNLSATGAVGMLPFRASFGFLNQEGVLLKNKFDRLSASLNLSPKFLNDHLSVNVNARASRINNNFSDQGAVGSAVAFDPTQPLYSANKFGGFYEWLQADGNPIDLATRNPLSLINLRDNRSVVNRFIGNVQLDYKLHFLPDLHVLLNLGLDKTKGEGNDNVDSLSATNYKSGGRKSHYEQGKRNTLADVQLFYAKEIKAINTKFDVLVGHSYQAFLTNVSNFASFSYRPISDRLKPALKDTIENSQPTFLTDNPEYRLESYLGRVNFIVADKYLITASLRRDASSKLSPDQRVGYFPAVAAAWKLKDEFFKGTNKISDLKLRASWGETGQQEGIGYYSYLTRYTVSNSSAQYQFGNNFYTFLRPEGYDASIKWESTATTNIGLDFGLFDNRISGSIDYYVKKTKDLLSNVPVAPGANFVNRITTNVGNMDVNGVEFVLNTTPVRTQDLVWDVSFNLGYNKRKITNLLKYQDPNFKGIDVGGIGIATGNFIGKNIVGYSPNTFFVYKQVYDKNDKPIEGLYEDINRDGMVNADDRYLYKKPDADVLFGFSTQAVYKKFSLQVTAHGMSGNYMFNQYRAGSGILSVLKNPISFIGNASVSYLETGFQNNSQNQFLSDYFIENASFLRFDNINLGYTLGRVLRNKASLRINGSIQNVGVITKYKGLDPENASDFGIDGNIYPRPRIYSLGLNLDF
ncbi:MAG: SusC/RagA family TonB-linked outer membrane protein [Flavisolibacter sp.]|jgi:TonB-linked SusC/RagA family outer membrane protein|nr:SusC/RagA family TonB-linked outer membrane protein [Flavisolibacter sp.]